MPPPPAPRPEDPPEWVAAAVRFTFGTIFGAVVGATAFFIIDWKFWYWSVTVMAAAAVVCGILAAKYGDGFWERLRGWWWW